LGCPGRKEKRDNKRLDCGGKLEEVKDEKEEEKKNKGEC